MHGRQSGPTVVPGKAAESLMIKMAGRTDKPFMPPKRDDPLDAGGARPPQAVDRPGCEAARRGTARKPKWSCRSPPESIHPVRGLAISPDKAMVAAVAATRSTSTTRAPAPYVRSLIDPKLTTPDKKPVKAAHLSLVESLAFSPDGKYIASGSFQEVILWDAQTGLLRHRITGSPSASWPGLLAGQ